MTRTKRVSSALDEARAGFTLVELLVVIGIISVLIAILLPTLALAQRHAQKVNCASNIRQILLAVQQYTDANRNYFPPAHYIDARETPANSLTGAPVLLLPYIQSIKVIVCPTAPEAMDLDQIYGYFYPVATDMPQYASYQYNYCVFQDALNLPEPPPCNRSSLHQPADLPLIYDGSVSSARGGPWEVVQARHQGPSFNTGFLDDHVESIAATAAGWTTGVNNTPLPAYTIDRRNRPFYYGGAEAVPNRCNSYGLPLPGAGAIAWGTVGMGAYP